MLTSHLWLLLMLTVIRGWLCLHYGTLLWLWMRVRIGRRRLVLVLRVIHDVRIRR